MFNNDASTNRDILVFTKRLLALGQAGYNVASKTAYEIILADDPFTPDSVIREIVETLAEEGTDTPNPHVAKGLAASLKNFSDVFSSFYVSVLNGYAAQEDKAFNGGTPSQEYILKALRELLSVHGFEDQVWHTGKQA